MTAQPQLVGPAVTVRVALDGEVADLDLDPRRPIRELVRHALAAHGLDPDTRGCCLAGQRLWYAHGLERVAELVEQEGLGTLGLLLPL